MRFTPLALLRPLAACAPPMNGPAVMPPLVGTCQDDSLPSFVGQPATQELGARMLAASGARTLRWVGYGMAVTMDFSPHRLTVYLDKANRVERASCG